MGGCASKPKESDTRAAESVPAEAPTSPKQAEAQEPVVAQESQNEAPLVDVSDPKEEGEKPAEPEAADAEAVPEEVAEKVTAEAEEDKAEGTVQDGEAKVVEEAPKEEGKAEESKTEGSQAATPATEAKSNEPLVTA